MYEFSVLIGSQTTKFTFHSESQDEVSVPIIAGSVHDGDVILSGLIDSPGPFARPIGYPPSPEELHYYLSRLQGQGRLRFDQTGTLTVEQYAAAPPGAMY